MTMQRQDSNTGDNNDGVRSIMINFYSTLIGMGTYLIKNEVPQKSDIIVVLGGDITGQRVAYGAKLYKLGYADKVLLSGVGRYMRNQALSHGIPDKAILLENKSMTTFKNAQYSFKIMKNQGYKSAIVVTSQYHTRRAGIIFTHFFKNIHLTICPVTYDPKMTQSWWNDRNSREFIISEYMKLVLYYLIELHCCPRQLDYPILDGFFMRKK
jgi:uncharacterized SAM-binding protein YcdF (DUF218 family)